MQTPAHTPYMRVRTARAMHGACHLARFYAHIGTTHPPCIPPIPPRKSVCAGQSVLAQDRKGGIGVGWISAYQRSAWSERRPMIARVG